MSNLRLIEVNVIDSVTIKARFTDNLDKLINKQNITITSVDGTGVPNPEVIKVTISNNVLSIKCSPLTPYATYYIKFHSTPSVRFKSLNGNAFLFEDGTTNVALIRGAEDPDNIIRDNLLTLLSNNIYNLDRGTLVRDIINSIADNLNEALHDIGQVKNDNYIDYLVKDEIKQRGAGPFDRLNEEGAFKIERVSKFLTDESLSSYIEFDVLPNNPISLQRVLVKNEILKIGDGIDAFDKLILTVNNKNVIKLNSVTIHYNNGAKYVYDIERLGYQIQNSRYDKERASTLFTLKDNQFKLNQSILDDEDFILPSSVNDYISISYEYKDLGIRVNEESIIVSKIIDVIREPIQPLQTVFSLKNPIVDDNDNISTIHGVEFLDPNSNPPFAKTHPAFIKEIPFVLDKLPSLPGEYSIDYNSGRVYVYGAVENDGTGEFPPVASYKYRYLFSKDLDYVYNSDTSELAIIQSRDAFGSPGKISFTFEKVLVKDIDYSEHIHIEVIDERVGNRIKTSNSLSTQKSPITNVFRIFNETTGEIYKISRWYGNTVYFNSNSPPTIKDILAEKISFKSIINEPLTVSETITNSNNVTILKIYLQNNNIISLTEDVIGSSYNSSVIFSRSDVFTKELYYDNYLDVSDNIDRLEIGLYQVDYRNGIVYLGFDDSVNNFDIGFVSYKTAIIIPNSPHVVNVKHIYNSININNGIDKYIQYISHSDGEIIPLLNDFADERFYNGEVTQPYYFDNGTITVTNKIKELRSIYDAYDLNNNIEPTNFASINTVINGNSIILDDNGIEKEYLYTFDSSSNNIEIPFISPGVNIAEIVGVIRVSDGTNFWDNDCILSDYTITLSSLNLPNNGDKLKIIYKVVLNGESTPIVDYSRGNCYIDYSAITDEILISYEYGDNVLDFRNSSNAIATGDTYYVTYRVGALRDALYKNFGSLVDIPDINNFDLYLNRETYRDILKAALHSFAKGPTHPALTNIVYNIAKTKPEIVESIFHGWSLGTSRLHNSIISSTNNIELFPGKFDSGVLINKNGQVIKFPISDNLRLDEGTLEFWVIPEWNGLDNDATLTFSELKRDNVKLDSKDIYIGENNSHPIINDNGEFSIHKDSTDINVCGIPSSIHTENYGLFIYYDIFDKRWIIIAKETIIDDLDVVKYTGKITTSGEFYDVITESESPSVDDIIRSYDNEVYFEFAINKNDKIQLRNTDNEISSSDGLSFMSDNEHYFFDFGKSESSNRFSIYKDGRGYLNFRVISSNKYDNKIYTYKVSADISNWKAGEKHFIATSWILNSINNKDELHLFIDGYEVPNIMKYGGRPSSSLTDRFRTIKQEIIIDNIDKDIIYGKDLSIVENSNIVTSASINFDTVNISIGDTITIFENIDNTTYTIVAIDGNSLELDNNLPATLDDVTFSINPYSVIVDNSINLYSNVIVSIIRDGNEIELPGQNSLEPSYIISRDEDNQTIFTLIKDALVGDQVVLKTVGLNHRRVRDKVYVWGDSSNILKTNLPAPINLDDVKIIPILLPKCIIGPDNATYNISDQIFESDNIVTTQPSNQIEGRKLNIFISGGNVDFSKDVVVSIYGNDSDGSTSEDVMFDKPGNKITNTKFTYIDYVTVSVKPIDNTQNSIYIEIKEAYPITYSDDNEEYPIIKYSYKVQTGKNLLCDDPASGIVVDENRYFSSSFVGQPIVIYSPANVAGTYKIVEKIDNSTIKIDPAPDSTFTGGKYDIFDVSVHRSGFQNGYFVFEKSNSVNEPYNLPQGYYEFDYASYLSIPFEPVNNIHGFIGSDINGMNCANSIIDEFRILSIKISDTKIGESVQNNQYSITKDYNAIRPFNKDKNTLMLLHFDSLPLMNDAADYWSSFNRNVTKTSTGVNSNFGQSLVVKDKIFTINNSGILDNNYGTIEFWISPIFDTANDPNIRYYFDASSAEIEEVVSISKNTIKVSKNIEKVLSVKLHNSVINNDDYFAGGKIHDDRRTIQLGTPLPNQKTSVIVNYIPTGTIGNRISIYKDTRGFINFRVYSNGKRFRIRRPIFWSRDTWHRVMVIYEFNKGNNKDIMRLFVDGEERGSIVLGSGILSGEGFTLGQGSQLQQYFSSNIKFIDTINTIFIGSDYSGYNFANARYNNIRISNIARPLAKIGNQSIDINYNSNIDSVYPVTEDLFTTYLSNFDNILYKNDDFITLNSKENLFDFAININDSFDIVLSDEKVKKALEAILFALKPANSRITINYKK